MRELVRRIVQGYKSLNLEGQDEGYVLFSGLDPDSKQQVLIKVLPRLLEENPQIAAQFNRLAQAIRQLNHPNIAPIAKVGEEAGLPYVVSRALQKAQPLAAKLDQPWAVDMAADVVMQVGQALDHAYRKGIVHGSLTPKNVEIQDDGRVTVTDLGLADIQKLVGVHIKQGASPYLAPERVEGRAADARADVYSMGALLYSLLTKRTPQVVKGEILPPSRFNPEVPPAMDEVVVKALAPDPASRYPDAKTFLTALGAVTLVPAQKEITTTALRNQCPKCGAENQSGRFCRRCGAQLAAAEPERPRPTAQVPTRPAGPARSVLDEPIQITKVEVGLAPVEKGAAAEVKIGQGVKVHETAIAQPMPVATGEMLAAFPEPLSMPQVGVPDLGPASSLHSELAMPEPPPMPVIDWAEIAPEMPEVPTIEDIPLNREGD